MFLLVTRKVFFTQKKFIAPHLTPVSACARQASLETAAEADVTHLIVEPFFVFRERMLCIEIFSIAVFCDANECNYFSLLQLHWFSPDDVSQMEKIELPLTTFSIVSFSRTAAAAVVEKGFYVELNIAPDSLRKFLLLKALVEVSDVSSTSCDNMLTWPRLSTISKEEREKTRLLGRESNISECLTAFIVS